MWNPKRITPGIPMSAFISSTDAGMRAAKGRLYGQRFRRVKPRLQNEQSRSTATGLLMRRKKSTEVDLAGVTATSVAGECGEENDAALCARAIRRGSS